MLSMVQFIYYINFFKYITFKHKNLSKTCHNHCNHNVVTIKLRAMSPEITRSSLTIFESVWLFRSTGSVRKIDFITCVSGSHINHTKYVDCSYWNNVMLLFFYFTSFLGCFKCNLSLCLWLPTRRLLEKEKP